MRPITPRSTHGATLAALLTIGFSAAHAQAPSVAALRCDALTEPIGIDDPNPRLAWQYQNPAPGAKQTAYRVEVFSEPPAHNAKADAWDSGRIASSVSNGIPYAGTALQPSHRYFWRVTVWGADGTTTTTSPNDWWETGLMQPANWHAQWIGHEAGELHRVRTAGALWISNPAATVTPGQNVVHAFRMPFAPTKPVRSAALYTTGNDTVAAWVNGTPVLAPEPLPAWGRLPWMTYRTQDVTASLRPGQNLLAVGVTHYARSSTDAANRAPMSTTLVLTYTDGSMDAFISDLAHWKTTVNPSGEWWAAAFDDTRWTAPERIGLDGRAPGAPGEARPWPTGPAALLRKEVRLTRQPVSARLYATALGAYTFRINGAPVGNQILAPGWTDYRERVTYQTYDVTPMLHTGPNAIGATLAPGWYATPLKWEGQGNNYGATQPALKAQLRLQYSDGSVQWVSTDGTWKAAESEIRLAEIYNGETRDQRLLAPGWDRPRFRDTAWHAATTVQPHEPDIVAQDFPPIREESALIVKAITEPRPGVYVLDFGQNMAAVPRLTVRGKRGDDIRLRFAEVLNPDGTIYTDNLRNAKATDHFILAGTGEEHFQPQFTFHGFRYAEVTGLRKAPTPQTLQAVVIHTDAPFTMQFSSGSHMINQLYSNVLWGQRSNFVGLPTDCPQRDERLGWSADAQVFWRTAAYDMDLDNFTRMFARDLRGTQVGTAMYAGYAPGTNLPNEAYGPGWSDAGVIIPWTGWLQSGDPRIIDENWSGMQAYLAQIEHENPNHLWQKQIGTPWGDWLTPTITTPEDLLATAYWAYDAHLMQQMAAASGRTADAKHYAAMFDSVKAAFQKAYIAQDSRVGSVDHHPSLPPPTIHPATGDAPDHFVETQTGYVLALHMDLLPETMRSEAADRLVHLIRDNHMLLGTGFLGTPYLLEVLCDTGHSDIAYHLLLNTQYPSWGYVIEHGATTTWERWNGDQMRNDPSMNSYNHYAYGAVAEWLYRYAGGIDTGMAGPGFQSIVLHPNFSSTLGSLSLKYVSSQGEITSEWQVHGYTVQWTVTLPANTHGILQVTRTNAHNFTIDGKPVATDRRLHATETGDYDLPAGTYHLTATLETSTGS
ncbi:family 78 glycoside hydrolase catalytic domain [Terriglobus sp.]|uniref:family 78 glycoside hydrolase catalytic domain n=1 Tax=Terriglobus sp. TaxID=1889013 RepID=UPI003AFF8D9B